MASGVNTQPDDQCGWRAFGGDKLDHGGDPGIDLRAGRNRPVQHGNQRAKALLIRVGDVLEDFSLVAKVRIERGSPGSGSLGDLIESGGCIALGMEQFPRGVADVGAGKFLARRSQGGLLGKGPEGCSCRYAWHELVEMSATIDCVTNYRQ